MITINTAFAQAARDLGVIGRQGENDSRQIVIDCAEPLAQYPGADIVCVIKRPVDATPYSAPLAADGDTRTLTLTSAETAAAGRVLIELRVVQGDAVLKSAMLHGIVVESLRGEGDAPGAPVRDVLDRVESVLEEAERTASTAKEAAEAAQKTSAEIASAEALRAASEQTRETNETERVTAENARKEAETARIAHEDTRVSAEQQRESAEDERAAAEAIRIDHEDARIAAENARISAENARETAEKARGDAEKQRVATEEERQAALTAAVASASGSAESANNSATAAAASAATAQEAQEAIDGFTEVVATEPTAQQMLAIMRREMELLNQLVENGMGNKGSLNGFSFSRGENDELIISYVNPDDETDTATSTFATKTLANLIAQELASINESLHTIAGMEQTAQTEG